MDKIGSLIVQEMITDVGEGIVELAKSKYHRERVYEDPTIYFLSGPKREVLLGDLPDMLGDKVKEEVPGIGHNSGISKGMDKTIGYLLDYARANRYAYFPMVETLLKDEEFMKTVKFVLANGGVA